MISANYVDGLELRIRELQKKISDEANASLHFIAENQSLKAERDALSQKLRAAQHESEALAAAVEALREHVKRVFLADQNNTGNEPSLSCFHRALDEANDAAQAAPQQHLCDVEAKAGRAGFIAGRKRGRAYFTLSESDAADRYAESVKTGEK